MLEITKNYLLDQNKKTIVVQIPIAEFEQIEEIRENYCLARLMKEVENDQTLWKQEALNYLDLLKNNNSVSSDYELLSHFSTRQKIN